MDARIEAWLRQQADVRAPGSLLSDASLRIAATTQSTPRRWVPALVAGRRRSPRLSLIAAFAGASAAAILLVGIGLRLSGFPPSTLPGVGVAVAPSASGARRASEAPAGLHFTFEVEDGILVSGTRWGALSSGRGTFTATGTINDQGTFEDDVSWTPDGTYTVRRTMTMKDGTILAVSTLRSRVDDFGVAVAGTWRITSGTGRWATATGAGDLHGSSLGRTEVWDGSVTP